MVVFLSTICHALTACSNNTADNLRMNKIIENSFSTGSQLTKSSTTDSLILQEDGITKIYTQAIAEFIKAAYKKDKTTFDTLYFGKHVYGQPDDFPDIELPETIENTQIRLVTTEVGYKKQLGSKSLFYVNMMGWVDIKKAEFVIVVFSNGAEHQFDYFIDFTYNTERKEFELETIQFENYLNSKEEKPKRITIYKGGKYTGDK